MRYRLLGSSGLRVSELALGTMTFSSSKLPRGDRPSPGARWSWCATEDDARRIFASYVNGGGNFVDTADIYAGGTAEHLVGELVAPIRERVVLATKFGLSTRDDDVTTSGSSYRTTLNAVAVCAGPVTTVSIYCGCMPGLASRRPTRWRAGWMHSSGRARCSTSVSPIPRRGLSRCSMPSAPLTAVRRSPRSSFATACSTAPPNSNSSHGASARDWRRRVAHRRSAYAVATRRRACGRIDLDLDGEDRAVLDDAAPPPRLFPHDVIEAVKEQLRGGARGPQLDMPPEAAF